MFRSPGSDAITVQLVLGAKPGIVLTLEDMIKQNKNYCRTWDAAIPHFLAIALWLLADSLVSPVMLKQPCERGLITKRRLYNFCRYWCQSGSFCKNPDRQNQISESAHLCRSPLPGQPGCRTKSRDPDKITCASLPMDCVCRNVGKNFVSCSNQTAA